MLPFWWFVRFYTVQALKAVAYGVGIAMVAVFYVLLFVFAFLSPIWSGGDVMGGAP